MARRSSVHSAALYQGLISLADGFPDVDGVVWSGIGAKKGFADYFSGEDAVLEVEYTGEDPYDYEAPEVATPINTTSGEIFGAAAGEPIRLRRLEQLVLETPIVQPADGAAITSQAFHKILESVCAFVDPAEATSTVDAAGAHNGEFDVTAGHGARYTVGAIISVMKNGKVQYAAVTGIDTDTITVTPRLTDAVEAGDTIRHCRTYAPRRGSMPQAKLLNLRFDADGVCQYLFNAVCTAVELVVQEGVGLLRFTIRPGDQVAVQSTDATFMSYTRPVNPPASLLQSCRHWTPDAITAPVDVPASLVAENFDLADDWSFSFTNSGTAERGGCGALVSDDGYTFSRAQASLTGKTRDVDPFRRMLPLREKRQFVLGLGPPDKGVCAMLMSGHLPQGEQLGATDEDIQEVDFTFRNSGWAGDEDVDNVLANTSIRLAFPKPLAA